MGFQINTNVNALMTHAYTSMNNKELSNALTQLGSGLRINSAADDGSGLAIADNLKIQAGTLGMGIRNGNDAIGIIQIADKAMDEQNKILDTIKQKATQAASDAQTSDSRSAIQKDISKLLKSFDSIAEATSFNGMSLLNGSFSNKSFQVGIGSAASVDLNVQSTNSSKIGQTRIETTSDIKQSGVAQLKINDVSLKAVEIGSAQGQGVGELAKVINSGSDKTGVKASFEVESVGIEAVKAGDIKGLNINGINIGNITVENTDNNGQLVSAINSKSIETGVEASMEEGKLVLNSNDGRGIEIKAESGLRDVMQMGNAGGSENIHIGGSITGGSDREMTTFTMKDSATTVAALAINGIDISGGTEGKIVLSSSSTSNAMNMVNAINAKTDQTGVSAYTGGSGTNAAMLVNTAGKGTETAGAGQAQVDTFSITVDIDSTTNLVEKGDTFKFTIDGVDLEYTTSGKEKSAREVVDNITTMISDAMDDGIFDKNSTNAMAVNRTATAGGIDGDMNIHKDNDARMIVGDIKTGTGSDSQTKASFSLTQVETLGNSLHVSGHNQSSDINLGANQIVFEAADARGSTITIESDYEDDKWADATATKKNNELGMTEGLRIKTDDDGSAEKLTMASDDSTVSDFSINGTVIGDFISTKGNVADLVDRINAKSDETGVTASLIDSSAGEFVLKRTDGSDEGIVLGSSQTDAAAGTKDITSALTITDANQIDSDSVKMIRLGDASAEERNYGTISLTSTGGADIKVETLGSEAGSGAGSISNAFSDGAMEQKTTNLSDIINGKGVLDKENAMLLMDVDDSAMKMLNSTRSDLGSSQNQLTSMIDSSTIMQVNIKSAESQIRDLDFAEASSRFQRHNLLAQSGSYAMAQANQSQQMVMQLLT